MDALSTQFTQAAHRRIVGHGVGYRCSVAHRILVIEGYNRGRQPYRRALSDRWLAQRSGGNRRRCRSGEPRQRPRFQGLLQCIILPPSSHTITSHLSRLQLINGWCAPPAGGHTGPLPCLATSTDSSPTRCGSLSGFTPRPTFRLAPYPRSRRRTVARRPRQRASHESGVLPVPPTVMFRR